METRDRTPKREIRRRFSPGSFEVRQDGDDGPISIAGHFAVFDQEAHGEVVRSGAFDKTLAEGDDVRLLVDHTGVPLARTKSNTLHLNVDDTGLHGQADDLDPTNPDVQRLVSAMGRGDIDQGSFAFTEPAGKNGYTEDGDLYELREVRLWDVSIVTYPWYDQTSIGLNELDDALLALRDGRPLSDENRHAVHEALGEPEPSVELPPPPKSGLTLTLARQYTAAGRMLPSRTDRPAGASEPESKPEPKAATT